MAPLRRYLRITKYSVLECRIYLDNPALAHSWLLNPRDPILPRVIDSVRPLVLPKLREERERSRKKSTKKRGIKDTVTEDDFEVSIFLTETSTRHSLLYKHKHLRDTTQTKLTSNSSKLTGASREAPVDVDDEAAATPTILREELDDDDVIALHDIPVLGEGEDETAGAGAGAPSCLSKRRRRGNTAPIVGHDAELGTATISSPSDEEDGDLFVSENEDEDEDTRRRPAKRRKDGASAPEYETGRDDKKKLGMDISYEGFAIYGRVLCLVVKRRGDGDTNKGKGVAVPGGARGSRPGQSAAQAGSAMMENWITSTQMPEAARHENELLDAT